MKNYSYLIDYIESLRKQGKYLFLKKEAAQTLGISDNALQNSIWRLSKKGKVAYLKKGLYQIIPVEYESVGSLPPEWILHDLMSHLGISYYIGLLSAAAFHGAAHQAPQIFQVICNKQIPDLNLGLLKICFYESKEFDAIPTQDLKTPAGYVKVSTPEGTAFDLMRYLHQSGHLNHVATILSELGDVIDAKKLPIVGQKLSLRYSQRLGYLLDLLGHESLTAPLHQLVSSKSLRYILLRSDSPAQNAEKNKKWHILINEKVESDI
ncbi:MAG: type IV toxin-antitoxin system AbiEi family antitoxin [Alphaproteobacteria bacterium]|nr:type IV toxin-antitoxin system AbiEi family antitoxin [Alphaproteobacteria bacterium]